MVEAMTDHLTPEDAALCEAFDAEVGTASSDARYRIKRPIIDQWGATVGTDYSLLKDIAKVEALRDGIDGTVWAPPTGEAYFLVCKARDRWQAEAAELRKHAEALAEALGVCQQTIMEVRAAQNRGAGWYTRGAGGLFQQVRMWLDKAQAVMPALAAWTAYQEQTRKG